MEGAGGWRVDSGQYVLTYWTAEIVDCAICDYAFFAGLSYIQFAGCSLCCISLETDSIIDGKFMHSSHGEVF